MTDILKTIHAIALKIMSFFSVIFPWMAPLTILASLVTAFDSNYTTLLNSINGLTAMVHGWPAATWIGQANRIMPIGEILAMMSALLGLKIATMTIRFIKSFIPTIN